MVDKSFFHVEIKFDIINPEWGGSVHIKQKKMCLDIHGDNRNWE